MQSGHHVSAFMRHARVVLMITYLGGLPYASSISGSIFSHTTLSKRHNLMGPCAWVIICEKIPTHQLNFPTPFPLEPALQIYGEGSPLETSFLLMVNGPSSWPLPGSISHHPESFATYSDFMEGADLVASHAVWTPLMRTGPICFNCHHYDFLRWPSMIHTWTSMFPMHLAPNNSLHDVYSQIPHWITFSHLWQGN